MISFNENSLKIIKNKNKPKHIAIIMDGNRRWSKENNVSLFDGYNKGISNALKIIKYCIFLEIKYVTLYTFSSENWKRPNKEVSIIMSLLNEYLIKNSKILIDNKIRLLTIGEKNRLSINIKESIIKLEKITKNYKKFNLILALSYGSRNEITRALRGIITDVLNDDIRLSNVNEDLISCYLDTNHIPDPDIIIRTGGDSRLSNFLLWQSSYSEIFIANSYWPDFSEEDFYKILIKYLKINRNFGSLNLSKTVIK